MQRHAAAVIKRMAVDHMHIVGDIFDRGPRADIILDSLMDYHSVDIQWGNHDILWMGAAAGNAGSIANVIRMCMRYGNLATLEDGYGINLLPLATFAMEVYGDDPCELFIPRTNASDATFDEKTTQLIARMHKAITIIQFKLEGEIIRRRPEFGMDDRLLLHHIDLHRGTIRIEGKEYELKDKNWPTLNAKDPYALSIEEEELMRRIKHSFECSEKLKKHMRCLFTHGSMYQVCNSNLLFHASVPMNPDGTLKAIRIEGTEYKGKALLDKVDQLVRTAYFDADDSAEARNALRKKLAVQRTEDFRNGFPKPGGGVPDELPADAPQFFKDYHAYYKTPHGYHKRSLNSNQGRNATEAIPFINFPLMSRADEIKNAVLVIHGEKAHSRYFGEDAFKKLKGDNKELLIIPGANHTDLYDNLKAIPFDKIEKFFTGNLK